MVGVMAGDDGNTTKLERLGRTLARALPPVALAMVTVAGGWAVGDAVLSGSPTSRSPSFVDSLLASSAVLAAARLAIIAAAAYVVASVAALVTRRQWPTRVGPVEVSAETSHLAAENTALREMLVGAEDRLEAMDERLSVTEEALDMMAGNVMSELDPDDQG